MGTMDGIIDTVSAAHPLLHLVGLLKTNGKLILVGAPIQPPELPVFPLILGKFILFLASFCSLLFFFFQSNLNSISKTKIN